MDNTTACENKKISLKDTCLTKQSKNCEEEEDQHKHVHDRNQRVEDVTHDAVCQKRTSKKWTIAVVVLDTARKRHISASSQETASQ